MFIRLRMAWCEACPLTQGPTLGKLDQVDFSQFDIALKQYDLAASHWTNSSTAFKWKLCCYWLNGLWQHNIVSITQSPAYQSFHWQSISPALSLQQINSNIGVPQYYTYANTITICHAYHIYCVCYLNYDTYATPIISALYHLYHCTRAISIILPQPL